MTQNSLSTKAQNPKQNQKQSKKQNKKSSLLRHTLGSYWWLAFACGVVSAAIQVLARSIRRE